MSSASKSEPGGMSRPVTVYLAVRDDRNRRLLARRLADSYSVVGPNDVPLADADADLYVVDAPSLERERETVHEKRSAADPTFLPFLLLRGERAGDSLSERVWEFVDDVIDTPVSGDALEARLENLLERRGLSLELERQRDVNEERFRSLFEAAPDPVVVTDDEGVITRVNEAFTETVGVSASTAEGARFADLPTLTPSVDAVDPVPLADDATTPTKEPVEWRLTDETLVTELNADVVRTGDDEWLGVFRDITALMEREAELERQNERLEEFASTVAHDLKNPLSLVAGFVEMTRKTGDLDRLDDAQSEIDRMNDLIEDVLMLAREGEIVTETTAVSLPSTTHDAWEYVDLPAGALDGPADEWVDADPERLRELFVNLFENAVEHGSTSPHPSSENAVESDTGSSDGPAVHVEVGVTPTGFYVADDGAGIPEDEREDLFDAGYTTASRGTGFGLAIVQRIAEGHGWEVSVTESEAGGARFDVTGVDFAD